MRVITLETKVPIKKNTLPSKIWFRLDVATFLNKSNKLLALLIVLFGGLLPYGFTNAAYYTESSISGSEFSTTCWDEPSTPILVSLADNAIINLGNPWLNNSVMDWEDSQSSCSTASLQYQFRVAQDVDFNSVVQTSPWISASEFVTNATQNGEYYWQVTVKDIAHPDIPVATSSTRHYTVNTQALQPPVNLGWNLPSPSSNTPNETPLDIVCGATTNGGDPNNPLLAHNWSSVSGANIKYQREVTSPSNAITFSYEINHYTDFAGFGGVLPDVAGLWKTRVKAFEDFNDNNSLDTGENASEFSNYCNVILQAEAQNTSEVVLNEILADPQGPDNIAIPFGEWVELYNRSDAPIDINGWKVTADDGNQFPLTIDSTNTFASLPFGVGTTTIPAHGFLVVYRSGNPNFDLKNIPEGVNDSETVRLFNSSDELQDEHTYTMTRENKSETRNPDGADNWVDPIPTPGRPNILEASELEPSLFVAQQDAHRVIVALNDALNYQKAEIVVVYKRTQDGEEVEEALQKEVAIDQNTQFIPDVFLGTVSSGTEYPHVGIHTVHVIVTLQAEGKEDKVVETSLTGNWRSE